MLYSHEMHNQKICNAFLDTLNTMLVDFPRIALFRVDLRMPLTESDAPSVFFDSEPLVITRFIRSLKSQLQAYQARIILDGKRVYRNRLRHLWVRELSKAGHYHYHVILFLNKDAFYHHGHFTSGTSLSSFVANAWCRALGISEDDYRPLAHFPSGWPIYVDRNSQYVQQQVDGAIHSALYLAKHHTKPYGLNTRCFGCSRR